MLGKPGCCLRGRVGAVLSRGEGPPAPLPRVAATACQRSASLLVGGSLPARADPPARRRLYGIREGGGRGGGGGGVAAPNPRGRRIKSPSGPPGHFTAKLIRGTKNFGRSAWQCQWSLAVQLRCVACRESDVTTRFDNRQAAGSGAARATLPLFRLQPCPLDPDKPFTVQQRDVEAAPDRLPTGVQENMQATLARRGGACFSAIASARSVSVGNDVRRIGGGASLSTLSVPRLASS